MLSNILEANEYKPSLD